MTSVIGYSLLGIGILIWLIFTSGALPHYPAYIDMRPRIGQVSSGHQEYKDLYPELRAGYYFRPPYVMNGVGFALVCIGAILAAPSGPFVFIAAGSISWTIALLGTKSGVRRLNHLARWLVVRSRRYKRRKKPRTPLGRALHAIVLWHMDPEYWKAVTRTLTVAVLTVVVFATKVDQLRQPVSVLLLIVAFLILVSIEDRLHWQWRKNVVCLVVLQISGIALTSSFYLIYYALAKV
jgi:hypothetical protein